MGELVFWRLFFSLRGTWISGLNLAWQDGSLVKQSLKCCPLTPSCSLSSNVFMFLSGLSTTAPPNLSNLTGNRHSQTDKYHRIACILNIWYKKKKNLETSFQKQFLENSLLQDELQKIKQLLLFTSSCSKYFISQLFQFCEKRGVKSSITTQDLSNFKLIIKENSELFLSRLLFLLLHFQKEAKANIKISIQLSTHWQI